MSQMFICSKCYQNSLNGNGYDGNVENTFGSAVLWTKSWLRSLKCVAPTIRARTWLNILMLMLCVKASGSVYFLNFENLGGAGGEGVGWHVVVGGDIGGGGVEPWWRHPVANLPCYRVEGRFALVPVSEMFKIHI